MKIRHRLTSWYFFVTLTILLLFSLGTYWVMRSLLFHALDNELKIVARTIEKSYDPFFNEFAELPSLMDNVNRFIQYYLIVYDTRGNLIYTSPMTHLIVADLPSFPGSNEVGFNLEVSLSPKVRKMQPTEKSNLTLRMISYKMSYRDRPLGMIIIGQPIERIEASMAKLLNVLIIGSLLVVLLMGTGGYLLTRKALDPVNIITQKANRISRSNLDERIKVENPEDELGQLSLVLNSLLQRLHAAFESQQSFLADAAHELKTPLAMLRAHWESELNNPNLTLGIKEKMVQDVETITRLSHLINNLLLLSQTETIQSNFDVEFLNLGKLLNDVISDTGVLAELKNQKILANDLPEVKINGDKTRLYQLFFNLIDNAIKYTPDNGKIWVSLREEQEWAIIKVRDNGVGIPQAHLSHIFERFYRVQKDRARKTGGSGLGLSICKLIAESHGGNIEVESQINEGSTFTVKLPYRYSGETHFGKGINDN